MLGLDASAAQAITQQYQVKIFPSILCFIGGILADCVAGFGELGGTDNFPTSTLINRLRQSGVLQGGGASDVSSLMSSQANRRAKTPDYDGRSQGSITGVSHVKAEIPEEAKSAIGNFKNFTNMTGGVNQSQEYDMTKHEIQKTSAYA